MLAFSLGLHYYIFYQVLSTRIRDVLLANIGYFSRQINKYQKKLGLKVTEELGANATQDDYIKDFLDSDAPQFKGKTKDKIIQMAVAAFKNK